MPLVTSSSIQGNLFRQASTPSNPTTGDVWVDTDNGQIFTYNGTSWVQQTGGALGTASQLLKVNSGATALEYGTGVTAARIMGLG